MQQHKVQSPERYEKLAHVGEKVCEKLDEDSEQVGGDVQWLEGKTGSVEDDI